MILGLYGASGLGIEYFQLACEANSKDKKWDDIVFVDDTPEKKDTLLMGKRVFSFDQVLQKYKQDEIEFIISMGEPESKDKIFKKVKDYGYHLGLLIHPTSSIGSEAVLGEGVVIQAWSRIPPMAKIGNNVLIQGTTCLGHAVEVGDNSVISSFAFVGGATTIGKNSYIAPHSCLRNGIKIGDNTIIGMGSVVTKDISGGVVAYGNPAKVMRTNESGKVFNK